MRDHQLTSQHSSETRTGIRWLRQRIRRRRRVPPRVRARALSGILAGTILVGGLVTLEQTPVAAVPRGEQMTFPGGLVLSNYVMPNGVRAYCIEIQLGEPSGYISEAGRVTTLPGRPGMFPSWGEPAGMRQMNYLIDRHGQNGDAWSAAAVQLSIWRLRANFLQGNPFLNSRIATLEGSAQGRALIAASDLLVQDARKNAQPPSAPRPVTGGLAVTPDPAGVADRYRVAYPAGTTDLSVSGGVFVRNGATTLSVAGTGASARYVDITPGMRKFTVDGSWLSTGTVGWEPRLDIYNTSTASGGVGQRLAVATGDSRGRELRGRFDTVTTDVPPPFADPVAVTQAAPTADVGGTMRDTLVVSAAPDTQARLWPGAVADFTAYLEPAVGAPKYDENWEPILGSESPPEDEAGAAPGHDERAEVILWTAAELDAMSAAERCVVQPVYREGGIAVTRLGEYHTADVRVRSAGTINWVERIVSGDKTVHQGVCGVPHERTATEQPGVVTLAPTEIRIGERATDTATLTGRFAPQANYFLRFEAFRAEESAAGVPLCTNENRIYRSEEISVSAPGDVVAPGFIARWEHGTRIWWVETLSIDTGDGSVRLHRGTCGLDTETTEIGRPEVVTHAPEHAVVGDVIQDTAVVSGELIETEHARWELSFAGYRGQGDPQETQALEIGAVSESHCSAETLLFETGVTAVSGPGEYQSEGVRVPPGWAGTVWWVETLWLIEGDVRTAVAQGSCGAVNESTRVSEPSVETVATGVLAPGELMRDTAEVTGELSARDGLTHDLVFEAYRGDAELTGSAAAECSPENLLFRTDPVAITGPGTVTSPELTALPQYGETVWWVAVLRLHEAGTETELFRGSCGAPEETTTIQAPHVWTESAGTVVVGDDMFDVAIVEGRLADRPDVTYRVTFTAYSVGDDGLLECTPERVIPELSDLEGVSVTGPGRYASRSVTTTAQHVGVGGYVETLLMREGGVPNTQSTWGSAALKTSASRFMRSGSKRPCRTPEELVHTSSCWAPAVWSCSRSPQFSGGSSTAARAGSRGCVGSDPRHLQQLCRLRLRNS